MKKTLIAILLVILSVFLISCRKDASAAIEPEAPKKERAEAKKLKIDIRRPSDLVFDATLEGGESFVCLEGENIASGDYYVKGNELFIRRGYWTGLKSGEHVFKFITTEREKEIVFDIDVQNKENEIVNGGFETGDLTGWTVAPIVKGEEERLSFVDEGVKANDFYSDREIPYGGVGRYVYGFDDRGGAFADDWNERTGVMRSSEFTLGGCGFVSFMLGGGRNVNLCYLSVRDAVTDEEIARYGNAKFRSTSYISDPRNFYEANLAAYKADLSAHIGKKLYFEFVDAGSGEWDFLTVDEVVAYYEKEPQYGELATDIRPSFDQSYVTNNLFNGDLALGGAGFFQSDAKGLGADVLTVSDGVMKSDAEGNASKGTIRSSLFRADGSGVVSMKVGAACGKRFEKDTYISIKERNTNRELFRFVNRNANGSEMILYYIDLSEHVGKECYIEIVDNAAGDYDVVFVSEIVTYYATAPDYDFGNAAVNVAYIRGRK